jgi:hypothetical protein
MAAQKRIGRMTAKPLFQLPIRLGLDAVMTLLLVTSLAFRITGREPHEWIGLVLCLLFSIHIVINRRWFTSIFKGAYSFRRMLEIGVNLALVAGMTVLCVTGILNSRHLFGFSQYFDGETIRQLHSLAAYWVMVLIGVHAGLQWEVVLAPLQKISWAKRKNTTFWIVLRALAVLIVGYGVWASFDRDMGSKLFLGFSFDFWEPSRPLFLFFTNNLSIIGMYTFAAHYARKRLSVVMMKILLPVVFLAVTIPSAVFANSLGIQVKITVGEQTLTATFLDNATTRHLISRFPLTIPMMDLYSREMCYRFPDALPANEVGSSGYEVGDIAYWTPRHSLVIFYRQNGEVISNLQKIGYIDSGVDLFSRTGNAEVRFELLDDQRR